LADTLASNLKGNTGTITKRCVLLKLIAVPGTKIIVVNIEKKKKNVVINLKWPNLD
jgi:hypothetical protein